MKTKTKKLLEIIIIALIIILPIGYNLYYNYTLDNYEEFVIKNVAEKPVYIENITNYQETYNNKDIKALVYIENTDFKSIVVQGKDNDYYLNHLPDKSYNFIGSVFFDYRINIDTTKKILIFGHSSTDFDLPIEVIEDYVNESFYEDHKYIYIDTENAHRTFKVIGAYVETSDWSYMKVNFKNNDEADAHFNSLLANSFYETGETITGDDTMLIIQTCSTLADYKNYSKKYFLLLAKEV